MTEELSAQERAVLRAVAANPYDDQQTIANALGLARSTVAAHIAQLTRKGHILGRAYVLPQGRSVACLGGATVDRTYTGLAPIRLATSNPVTGRSGFGGVARNVAETLARLGASVSLATRVGDDAAGRALIRHLQGLPVDTSRIALSGTAMTAEYAAVLGPDGELVLGIADMAVFDEITLADLDRWWPLLAAAAYVFADCNLPAPVLAALIERRRGARFRLAIDAVSASKVLRLPEDLTGIDLLVMNQLEAESFLRARQPSPEQAACRLRACGAAHAVVTLGAEGMVLADAAGVVALPAAGARAIDTTGAGDALVAGTLHRLLAGDPMLDALRAGALLAARTTEAAASVHPALSPQMLEA